MSEGDQLLISVLIVLDHNLGSPLSGLMVGVLVCM